MIGVLQVLKGMYFDIVITWFLIISYITNDISLHVMMIIESLILEISLKKLGKGIRELLIIKHVQ